MHTKKRDRQTLLNIKAPKNHLIIFYVGCNLHLKIFKHSLSHRVLKFIKPCGGPSEFKVTGNLKNFERMNDLKKLTMPTLITCGRFDEASPQTMQKAQEKSPNAQKQVILKKVLMSLIWNNRRII